MNSDVREASHPATVGEQAWWEVAALIYWQAIDELEVARLR